MIFTFFFTPSFCIEIIWKSIKCETQKKTIRGYPFFFFFENETNVKSFFISEENLIKFHNLNYKDVKPNFIEHRPLKKPREVNSSLHTNSQSVISYEGPKSDRFCLLGMILGGGPLFWSSACSRKRYLFCLVALKS